MAKVLVLYYSSYGHIEKMAQAIAEGARSAGAEVDIKRVPETVPDAIASWIKPRRLPLSPTSNITTPSSSAPEPGSGGSPRKWRRSSTKPAGCGRAVR